MWYSIKLELQYLETHRGWRGSKGDWRGNRDIREQNSTVSEKPEGWVKCCWEAVSDKESVQLLSRVRLCSPMDCSMPGFPVHHQLPELNHSQKQWVCILVFSLLKMYSAHPYSSMCLSPSHVWLFVTLDYSLPCSSVHGILQARILEYWLPFSSPGDLPDPETNSGSPILQVDSLLWATREASYLSIVPFNPYLWLFLVLLS